MEPGIEDEQILALANERSAVLLTTDKDFGELVFRLHKISAGILLLRLAELAPMRRAEMISSAIRQHASRLSNSFTVVSPGMVRMRPKRF